MDKHLNDKLNAVLSRERQDIYKFAYDLRNYLEGVLNYMEDEREISVRLTDKQIEFIMVLLKETLNKENA